MGIGGFFVVGQNIYGHQHNVRFSRTKSAASREAKRVSAYATNRGTKVCVQKEDLAHGGPKGPVLACFVNGKKKR